MSCNIASDPKVLRTSSILQRFIVKPSKKNKPIKKNPKFQRCNYETIPFPLKYNTQGQILIYGNIPIAQQEKTLCCDFSILNKFHVYREITRIPYQDQQILSIKTERRTDTRFSRWKTVLKKISKTRNSGLVKWTRMMKKFSYTYEKKMREYCTKIQHQLLIAESSSEEKKTLDLMMEQRENKKRTLLSRYPCIQLKTVFRGLENRLTEVVVNEKLIQALGYKMDSFVSLTLKEGLPQLFETQENQNNSAFLQSIIKQYSTAKTYDYQTSEIEVALVTKSGFVKPARVQVYFFMNLVEESPGSDTIFVITGQGIPYLPDKNSEQQQYSKNFLNIMCSEEKDVTNFLQSFYNHSLFSEYSNLNKVCCVKEINEFEYLCKAEDCL